MIIKIFFIQVGANDGVRFDDLYSFVTSVPCKGIVIEPIKYYYDKLRLNYKNFPNIIPCNVAIHKSSKTKKIYYVNPDCRLDEWTDGIGSFLKKFHKKKVPSEAIISEDVKCIHLMELINLYKVKKINLIQIDAEGYDMEIVKMINFGKIKPHIIKYEKRHISKVKHFFLCWHLKKNNYDLFFTEFDAIAVLKKRNF